MNFSSVRNKLPFASIVYLVGTRVHVKVSNTTLTFEAKSAKESWEGALAVCDMAGVDDEAVAWVRENPCHIIPSTRRRAAVAAIKRVAHAQDLLNSVAKKAS